MRDREAVPPSNGPFMTSLMRSAISCGITCWQLACGTSNSLPALFTTDFSRIGSQRMPRAARVA